MIYDMYYKKAMIIPPTQNVIIEATFFVHSIPVVNKMDRDTAAKIGRVGLTSFSAVIMNCNVTNFHLG